MHYRFASLTALLCLPFLLRSQQWEKLQMPVLLNAMTITAVADTLVVHNDKCLYKSTDKGLTWSAIINDSYTIIGFYPDTLHDRYYYIDGPNRIYESTDFGATWIQTGTMPVVGNMGNVGLVFVGDEVYAYDEYYILHRTPGGPLNGWESLLYFPQDTFAGSLVTDLKRIGDNFWAATTLGIRFSDDNGATWNDPLNKSKPCQIALAGDVMLINYPTGVPQMYRSLDAGDSWELINPNVKPEKIFSSEAWFFAEKNNALYRSSNGLDWELILTSDFPLTFTDVAVQDEAILLPYFSETEVNEYVASFLRSDDAGQTWKHVIEGFTCGSSSGGFAPLQSMDGYLLAGANHGFSDDQGLTWTRPFVEGSPSSDIFRIGNQYVGFHGLYFYRCSANGRFEWKRVFTGIGFQQILELNGLLYGTDGQTIYRSSDAGSSWNSTGTKPSGQLLATAHGKLITTQGSSVVVSTDEGATWNPVFTFAEPVSGSLYGFDDSLFLSITAQKRLFVSADDGLSFDTLDTPVNPGSSTFRFRFSGDNLYLWLGGNQLHFSTDNGQSWVSAAMPAGYIIQNELDYLAIDKHYVYAHEGIKMYCWRLHLDDLRNAAGSVFLDYDGNGLRDFGEPGIPDILVMSSVANAVNHTNASGRFSLTLTQADDTLRVAGAPPAFEAIPSFALSQSNDNQPIDFGLHPTDTISDLAVALAYTPAFRAGFNTKLVASLSNRGTVKQSGKLTLVLDPNTAFVAADPPVAASNGDTLIWHYTDLQPLVTNSFTVNVTTSVVPPGTPVRLTVNAPDTQDTNPGDNEFDLNESVVASYDPNDKVVSPAELPVAEVSERELIYTVRFQNLGNTATDFIVVRDTLSALLDLGTLRVLSSSHPCSWSIKDSRSLEFRFSPIVLSPAQTDEANSHGFIRFSVKMKPGVNVGQVVANTAHIYFDFNPAVITNTVTTTVKQFVSTYDRIVSGKITMSPNPAHQSVLFQINPTAEAGGVICVWDSRGRLICRTDTQGSQFRLQVHDLPTGVYYVHWRYAEKNYAGRFVVQQP